MLKNLDDFVKDAKKGGIRNSYVRFNGFEDLYVRYTRRCINGKIVSPVFDLAYMAAKKPGRGGFSRLFSHLRKNYPECWLYVESVMNKRFEQKLLSIGFIRTPSINPVLDGAPNFYLPPVSQKSLSTGETT